MVITVNGEPTALEGALTVADVLPAESRGTAVALNGVVVPRHRHAAQPLADGDRLEIVTAVQGG